MMSDIRPYIHNLNNYKYKNTNKFDALHLEGEHHYIGHQQIKKGDAKGTWHLTFIRGKKALTDIPVLIASGDKLLDKPYAKLVFHEYTEQKIWMKVRWLNGIYSMKYCFYHEYAKCIERCQLCESRRSRVYYFENNHRAGHGHKNSQRILCTLIDSTFKHHSSKSMPLSMPIDCLNLIVSYL